MPAANARWRREQSERESSKFASALSPGGEEVRVSGRVDVEMCYRWYERSREG